MIRSAAFLVLPSGKRTVEEKDDLEKTSRLLAESLDDLRLAERVARALHASGYGPLRGIAVTTHRRLVTLEGRVPSYYLKQIAQSTALSVPGVDQVRNELRVGAS
jgi:osmotically-inducible protein OsmY